MFARWSSRIASAAPAEKTTTRAEEPKASANRGSARAASIDATDV
jgi:hypothetical protein